MGRLNRWNTYKKCMLYILDDYICGFGSKKNPHIVKNYNGVDVYGFDPYFADEITSLNQHNNEYKLLDGITLGYEESFLNHEISIKMDKYKDLWFHGILNGVKRYILSPSLQRISPVDYSREYKYSLSILPYIFIRTANPDFVNQCFREVNASEFIEK
jgi:hypothetical protein